MQAAACCKSSCMWRRSIHAPLASGYLSGSSAQPAEPHTSDAKCRNFVIHVTLSSLRLRGGERGCAASHGCGGAFRLAHLAEVEKKQRALSTFTTCLLSRKQKLLCLALSCAHAAGSREPLPAAPCRNRNIKQSTVKPLDPRWNQSNKSNSSYLRLSLLHMPGGAEPAWSAAQDAADVPGQSRVTSHQGRNWPGVCKMCKAFRRASPHQKKTLQSSVSELVKPFHTEWTS